MGFDQTAIVERTQNGRWHISIRVALLLGIVGCVILTALLVHVPWYLTSQRGVTDLRGRLNNQIIWGIREQVGSILEGALSTLEVVEGAIQNDGINIEDEKERSTFFLSLLKAQPTLSSIEFVWPNDRSFLARRADSTNTMLETIDTTNDGPQSSQIFAHYEIKSESFVTTGEEGTPIQYNPNQQFWYRQAFAESGVSWSNIYPMFKDKHLGFTAVTKVPIDDNSQGVAAVSIELKDISSFLKNIFISQHGTVILTNKYGELVAAQEDNASHPVGVTRKLEESPAPLVQIAAKAIAGNKIALDSLNGTKQVSYFDPERRQNFFVTVAPLAQMELIIALVVPENDLLGEINRNTHFLLYALGIFLVLLAILVVIAGRWMLGRPIVQVTENARQLEDFRFESIKPVSSVLSEVNTLSQAITQMGTSLSSFKKYVPTEVVRQLFAEGIEAELGGEKRELSIFFIDLVGFTGLSEALGDELIPFLSVYLNEISDEVRHGQGTIDKYIGDAVMAFWGAPKSNAEHALFACRTALACQERLARLRAQHSHIHDDSLRARIGINTGRVLVGNIGSNDRLNYTVIGDPVNVASRLESLNKVYGTNILIGEKTYEECQSHIIARRLDKVAVYGREQGIDIFELLAMRAHVKEGIYDWVDVFEDGMQAYRSGKWDVAINCFQQVIHIRGEDKPSTVMIGRAMNFKKTPPPPNWNGILVAAEK